MYYINVFVFLFTEEHRQEIESQSAQMISEFFTELDSKKNILLRLNNGFRNLPFQLKVMIM